MNLSTPIENLPLIGPAYAKRLNRLQIHTVKDLLHHYPHRYQDLRLISKINQIQEGETVTIQGKIISCKNVYFARKNLAYTRSRRPIQKAIIADATGQIEATWFNQTYLPQTLKPGTEIALAGRVSRFGPKLTLTSPEYEILKGQPIHTGRLVPIYPETRGLSSKWLRSRLAPLIQSLNIKDHLPPAITQKYQLINLTSAISQIHFPDTKTKLNQAKKRLAFDELFLLQLEALKRKSAWQKTQLAHNFSVNQNKVLQFISQLPFSLTPAQNQAVKQILADLSSPQPMNRLLQGDVGSGKTVVAAIAIYVAYLNGFQSILMAPTEILAQQHFHTLSGLFKSLNIQIELITSASKKQPVARRSPPAVLVGTHALLHRQLNTPKLGLVIIDEQHRFGVEQRARLIKRGVSPHLLTMTATPIPRTIALTLYADLDLSTIDQLPPGRQPVKTWLVPPHKRPQAYDWIKKELMAHRTQAFIVYPLIDQSETLTDIKAATQEFDQLKTIFSDFNLALLHGRTPARDKQTILKQLARGNIDILVSTPVVEVGLDLPQATIMVIESAERFGLSTLHQLRGRVGRGHHQSYCLLFTSKKFQTHTRRLKALTTIHSGIKLAELDLKLRGPGHLYGTAQHGFLNLKLASLTDTKLLQATKSAADSILKSDPKLKKHPLLKHQLKTQLEKSILPN